MAKKKSKTSRDMPRVTEREEEMIMAVHMDGLGTTE